MRVSTALLCDSATIRENLLHVLGGGITRLYRAPYPAAIDIALALLLELEPGDEAQPNPIAVRIKAAGGDPLFAVTADVGVANFPVDTDGLPRFMPLVVILRGELPEPGLYRVELEVGSTQPLLLPFRAELPRQANTEESRPAAEEA